MITPANVTKDCLLYAPTIRGVYIIYSDTKPQWFYIGSTANFQKRWREHIKDLRLNRHTNVILQRIYNKYNDLVFEVIELTDSKSTLTREQYWLDLLKPTINISKQAFGGDNFTNNPNKEIIRQKISRGLRATYTDPERRKKPPMSEETRHKISVALRNSQKHSAAIRASFTEERRKAISDRCSGNNNPRARHIEIDGVKYLSILDAEQTLPISRTTIKRRLKSENFPNYRYL